jgi:hypothetical protein
MTPDTDEIEMVKEEGLALIGEAEAMAVTDQPSFDAAGAFLRKLKGHIKRVEEFFLPMKRSADAAKKAILDQEKATLEGPKAAAATLDRALAQFESSRRREAAIAQARAAEEARAVQAARPVGAPPVLIPAAPVAIPSTPGVSFRTYYRAEVRSLAELIAAVVEGTAPMEAVMPDQSFLNKQAGTKAEMLKNGGETPLYPGVTAIGERKSAAKGSL